MAITDSSRVTRRINGSNGEGKMKGLKFRRFYTQAGVDPYSMVEWERRNAVITGDKGEIVFEQQDVEFPVTWSQMATRVVVSKYFRGTLGTSEREWSLKQLISRVVNTITGWGETQQYFATEEDRDIFHDELTYLLLFQHASFNSPVWFNCGVEEYPQCSACFINSVDDTMDSILTLARTEGMLFKYGSGQERIFRPSAHPKKVWLVEERLPVGIVHEGI